MKRIAYGFAAVIAFGTVSAHAGAVRSDKGEVVKTVTINNANLAEPQRATKVYRHLEEVAAEVCQLDGRAPVWVLREDRDCTARALTQAVRDLNSPALSEVHAREGARASAYASKDQ